MNTQSRDTTPEAEALQFHIWAEMPPWRKLEIVNQLYETAKQMTLARLRQEYPHATQAEIFRRYADLRLGPELAAKVYGPIPGDHTP